MSIELPFLSGAVSIVGEGGVNSRILRILLRRSLREPFSRIGRCYLATCRVDASSRGRVSWDGRDSVKSESIVSKIWNKSRPFWVL